MNNSHVPLEILKWINLEHVRMREEVGNWGSKGYVLLFINGLRKYIIKYDWTYKNIIIN